MQLKALLPIVKKSIYPLFVFSFALFVDKHDRSIGKWGMGREGLGTYICAHPLAGGGLTHIATYSKKAIIITNRNRTTL